MNAQIERRPNGGGQPSQFVLVGWVVAILALVAGGAGALVLGRDASIDRDEVIDHAASLELLEVKNELAWLHHDLLTDYLVAEYNQTTVSEEAEEQFRNEREAALTDLRALADEDGDAAAHASRLLSGYDRVDFSGDFTLGDLEEQYFLGVADAAEAESYLVHTEGYVRTILPRLVVLDSLAVAITQRSEEPGDFVAGFVDLIYSTVSDEPGWFGPDRQTPFEANYISRADSLSVLLGADTTEVLDELRVVWDYDRWLIDSSSDSFASEPPTTVEQLMMTADVLIDASRSDARNALDKERAEVLVASGQGRVGLFFGFGTAFLVLAVVAFAGLMARLLGRHRSLTESVLTDPLTGARNRRFLDTEVAGRCQRAGSHHLIVMVDLDRFKIVNDTWGHDVGDVLLRRLVIRLEEEVAALAMGTSGLSTSVVRIGGDEFVVALHSPTELDVPLVEGKLRAIAGPMDAGVEELIDLQFSLGVAHATGSVDVADLLRSADLAAYEDKNPGATGRPARMKVVEDPLAIDVT